jgi:endoglucanase
MRAALLLCLFALCAISSCFGQSSVRVTSSPATVSPTATSFQVTVGYVSSGATADRTVVIDILNSASSWFGKGSTSIGTTSSGSVSITVSPSGLSAGAQYILKAWMVATSTYTSNPSTAWQSSICENTTVTFTTTGGTVYNSSSSGGGCTSCKLKYFGVNLSGAEFGDGGSNHALSPSPGTAGQNYVYSEPGGSASWFAARGMNTFRIPVRWERLQATLGGALTTSDLNSLSSAITYITGTLSSYAIIDIHNYARYNGNLVNTSFPNDQLKTFWNLLANQFKSNSKVMFGLMNEPYSMDTDIWVGAANAAIAGIRASGATNIILVPGNRYTGAHSWAVSNDGNGRSNADALLNIVDSGNNFIIEMHQYLDSDYSGTQTACVSNTWGSDALVTATSWLRTNKLKGFIGEFGGGANTQCYDSIDLMLAYMENNADVWTGWTWWSAGPWWGSYFLSIEPSSGVAAAQFSNVLQNHICNSTMKTTCNSSSSSVGTSGTSSSASGSGSGSISTSGSGTSKSGSGSGSGSISTSGTGISKSGSGSGYTSSSGTGSGVSSTSAPTFSPTKESGKEKKDDAVQIGVGAGVGAVVVIGGVGGIVFYAKKKKLTFQQLITPRATSPTKPSNTAVQL